MENNILNNENAEEAKKIFQDIVEMGTNFKLEDKIFEKKFYPEEIDKELSELPIDGKDMNEIIKTIKGKILPYCTNFSSSKFMGFPDAGNSISGISGAILTDFLQQNLINSSFCSPIGTYLEMAVIQWLRTIVGYKNGKIEDINDVGGIITYGGTGSNSIAMLLARENHIKNTMQEGVKDPSKYKVILPKGIGHYSIRSSLMWIGCRR